MSPDNERITGEHGRLVRRAVRWLHKSLRCKVVVSEVSPGYGGEVVDALGWLANTRTILVECKVSMDDYYRDRAKPWRRRPETGVGQLRYYLCEPGVIDLQRTTLPERWGLLYCKPRTIQVVQPAAPFPVYNWQREMKFLMDSSREVTGGESTDDPGAPGMNADETDRHGFDVHK